MENHHKRQELCTVRPKYRQGRELKAVKTYTVAQESKYILVVGLPAIVIQDKLERLMGKFGKIAEWRHLKDYPSDEFTETVLFKYHTIQSARAAKRKTDDKSFYGGVLHVCYAPEYESVEDIRNKLKDRQMSYCRRLKQLESEKAQRKHRRVQKEENGNEEDDDEEQEQEQEQEQTETKETSQNKRKHSNNINFAKHGNFNSMPEASLVPPPSQCAPPPPPPFLPPPPSINPGPMINVAPYNPMVPPPPPNLNSQHQGQVNHWQQHQFNQTVNRTGPRYPGDADWQNNQPHHHASQSSSHTIPHQNHTSQSVSQTKNGVKTFPLAGPAPPCGPFMPSGYKTENESDKAKGKKKNPWKRNISDTPVPPKAKQSTPQPSMSAPANVLIKAYQPERLKKAAKFVPRQVSKGCCLPKHLTAPDSVSETLRKNAMLLKETEAGPTLPPGEQEVHEARRAMKRPDPHMEDVMQKIRDRVKQYTEKSMLPPQLKRKKAK